MARVVLKLSGEAFADPELQYGIDPEVVDRVAEEISAVRAEGHEIAIVVGGGNIFRGVSEAAEGMDRANADYMGMLATVINALALRDALERAGSETRVQTAINIQQVAEPYIRLRAIRPSHGRSFACSLGPVCRARSQVFCTTSSSPSAPRSKERTSARTKWLCASIAVASRLPVEL